MAAGAFVFAPAYFSVMLPVVPGDKVPPGPPLNGSLAAMRATAEGPVQSTSTAVTAPVERSGKRTVVHVSAREHQRSSFGGIVIVSDVAVCSASYFYRHFVLRMQAVESHLFDEAFICRAYVAELLIVSGVCVVCVACTLIAAVVLAVLDVDSVTELPYVAEPVLNP